MKIEMTLVDDSTGKPHFDATTEGSDPEMKSMAYSVYVLFRMVLDLLNSPYRSDMVSFIGTLHNAHRNDEVESAEFQTGEPKCH